MFLTMLYFLLALLLLVTVHEYGHFQVARWCGVKVLRFSFGFGPILARLRDKKGTEYAFSLLPLGGYVKMLDESEAAVAENERHLAFNNQVLWKRVLIVLAGPFFNFLFAFAALWLVLIIGIYSLAPIIEFVKPNSIAAQAGLKKNEEIIAINDNKINSWRDFQYTMMAFIGSQETIQLTMKSLDNGQQHQVFLPLADWKLDNKKPDPFESLGFEPFIPSIPPVVDEVIAHSPAAKAGLKKGDRILSVGGKPFTDWLFLVEYVQAHPETKLLLLIKRNNKTQKVFIQTGSQKNKGKVEGFLGVRSQKAQWPSHWLRLERQGPLSALGTALKQTMQLTGTTFSLMGRLVTGKLGLDSISGPVGIAQQAGDSGRSGLTSYLFFLALVSISLGALNLLPIPMLDGGHLFFYLLEAVRHKPVSENVKSIGAYWGLLILAVLMFIALTNDLSRISG